MGASNLQTNKETLSYELYKELADEICAPISDTDMTVELRFELYKSKLIYLYHIHEQCFRNLNTKDIKYHYTQDDFIRIQNAIEITKDFLKQTIKESFEKIIPRL
jgi:hypothetical protein